MSAQEYGRFKEINKLHFDFTEFPSRISQELKECVSTQPSADGLSRPGPKKNYLSLNLNGVVGVLQLMQSDAFGARQMLALELHRPSEEEHKRYLGERARTFEEQLVKCKENEDELRAELNRWTSEYKGLEQAYVAEVNEWKCKVKEVEAAKQAEATRSNQQLLSQATEERVALERRCVCPDHIASDVVSC